MAPSNVLPIPIRGGTTFVFVAGIPWDLSKREAAKLARVVEAYANLTPPTPPVLALPPPPSVPADSGSSRADDSPVGLGK